ncbi:hypothetical protein L596_002200 [Steinernema carpocapsae]|nr:hypothetical protein L596_002200 [Steinernema carpocapsae]
MKTINQCVPAGETKPCIQDHESPAGLLQDDTFLWFANFCCENGCASAVTAWLRNAFRESPTKPSTSRK